MTAVARIVLALALAGCGRVAFDDQPGRRDGGADASRDAADATPAVGCAPDEITTQYTSSLDALPSWAVTYGSSQIVFDSAGLTIAPLANMGAMAYWGVLADNSDDFRGHRMFVEVSQMIAAFPQTQAIVRFVDGNALAQFYQGNGQLVMDLGDGNTMLTDSKPYDPVVDRWWQILDDGVTTHFQTSTNGIDWIERQAFPTLSFMATARIEIAAGYYGAQTMPLGTFRLDNLFVCD